MRSVVISDASTLIILSKIDELHLLEKVYGELITTPEIAAEFGEVLPLWIKIQSADDNKYQRFLATQIDIGEASAIALAAEYENVTLLLDDLKARKLAVKLGLKVTGALGVINEAKKRSLILKVKPLIEKILLTDFRISRNVVEEILRINNE